VLVSNQRTRVWPSRSIAYINARIRGYEMPGGYCTVLTAYIVSVKLRFL